MSTTWKFGYTPTSSPETVGTGNGSQTTFNYTVTLPPILPAPFVAGGNVIIYVNAVQVGTDDGNGNLTGTGGGYTLTGSTVNYSTGALVVTFTTAVTSGQAITVAYQTSTINTAPANNDYCIYNLKQVMKAAGWVVQSSSDGTTYNSSGDQITKGTSGTGGINNALAWFRIRAPSGTRELLFQRDSGTPPTNNGLWYVAVSKVGFSGGSPSATQTPTATDQYGMLGHAGQSTTVGYTDWFAGNAATTFHHEAAADSAAPYGVYSLAFPKNSSTSTSGFHMFLIDSLASGTYQSGDTDPYWYGWSASVSYIWATNAAPQNSTEGALASINGTFSSTACPSIVWPGGPNNAGWNANPYTGYDDLLPMFYYFPNTTYKGQGYYFKWETAASRPTPTLLSVTQTNDSLVFQSGVVPWNGYSVVIG